MRHFLFCPEVRQIVGAIYSCDLQRNHAGPHIRNNGWAWGTTGENKGKAIAILEIGPPEEREIELHYSRRDRPERMVIVVCKDRYTACREIRRIFETERIF